MKMRKMTRAKNHHHHRLQPVEFELEQGEVEGMASVDQVDCASESTAMVQCLEEC